MSETMTYKPPCPKCHTKLAHKDVGPERLCPECGTAISWGVTIGSIGVGGFRGSNDKGHWSVMYDYCEWRACLYGDPQPRAVYGTMPRYYDGRHFAKICDQCRPAFKKHQARKRRQKRRANKRRA